MTDPAGRRPGAPAQATPAWFPWALALPGIAVLLIAAWMAVSHVAFLARATVTEGRVAEFAGHVGIGSVASRSSFPVYEFALPDGSIQRSVGPVGGSRACCRVGDVVPIAYDPADPRRAKRLGFEDGWTFPTAFAGFGALWMAIWAVGAWGRLREARLVRQGRGREVGQLGTGGAVVVFGVIIGLFVVGAVAAVLSGFPGLAAGLAGFGALWLVLGWLVVRDQM